MKAEDRGGGRGEEELECVLGHPVALTSRGEHFGRTQGDCGSWRRGADNRELREKPGRCDRHRSLIQLAYAPTWEQSYLAKGHLETSKDIALSVTAWRWGRAPGVWRGDAAGNAARRPADTRERMTRLPVPEAPRVGGPAVAPSALGTAESPDGPRPPSCDHAGGRFVPSSVFSCLRSDVTLAG